MKFNFFGFKFRFLFLSIIVLLISVSPLKSFAMIAPGGGGGPTLCAYHSFKSNNNLFQNIQDPEYVNGLLRINFKLQDSSEPQNFYPSVDLYDSDCNRYGGDYYDWNNPPVINFPPHTVNFSLRFTSPTHFEIWNDDKNSQFDCSLCNIDFSGYEYPNNLQATFYIGDYFGYDYIGSDSLPITKSVGDSNVLFIPGFQGSRLYESLLDNSPVQLWEPSSDSKVQELGMNTAGQSVNNKIFTSDIVDEGNIFPFPQPNIYKSFMSSMDALVDNNTIADWKAFPYDWRYSPEYIVNHGIQHIGTNPPFLSTITYNEPIVSGNPYIIALLKTLADSSKNGKVTIVTHSNGGLVVKALIKKLEAMQSAGTSDLITKIDKVIMVAAPELGTPQAMAELLHGTDAGIAGGLVVDNATARTFGQNMPGAYSLLPSQKYFDTVSSPVVKFDAGIDSISNLHKIYGDTINTFSAFKNFALGALDHRSAPLASDTNSPSVLNPVMESDAETNHADLDNYQIPASIAVYQVVGWGKKTIEGVEYENQHDQLEPNPILVSDGDGIVVTPSAILGTAGTKYYLNLKDYDTFFRINRSHPDILEIDSLRTLIKNIITGDSTLPQYITTTKPTGSDDIVLSTHSPVSIDAYDAQGNHTGPVQSIISDFNQYEENIPNSTYLNFGEANYISLPTGGNYSINISGTDFGTFTFQKEHDVNDVSQTADTSTFTDIPVTPATQATLTVAPNGTPSSISLDIDGDGVKDATILPNTDFDPVLYLQMMEKTINALDLTQNKKDTLDKKADKIITLIQKGKIDKAKNKVNTIAKALTNKITKPDPKHPKNKKLSKTDAQLILDMLNTLLDNLK